MDSVDLEPRATRATRSPAIAWSLAAFVTGLVFLSILASDSNDVGWAGVALLGLVEGITEYLPVSSTGHLAAITELVWPGTTTESLDSYLIVIQAGAILAVLGLYWRRFKDIAVGLVSGGAGRRIALGLLVAFIPAALAGLVLGDVIKDRLFALVPIAAAWIAGGLVILWVEYRARLRGADPLETIELRRAGLIGLVQVLALWPGTSRSLATIVGGRLAGLSTAAAVEFSFLLGSVTLLAASVYEGAGNFDGIISDIRLGRHRSDWR